MSVTSERILEETGKLGITVGNIRSSVALRLSRVAQGGDNVSQSKKSTVDGNAFLDPLTRGSRTFELLATSANVRMR